MSDWLNTMTALALAVALYGGIALLLGLSCNVNGREFSASCHGSTLDLKLGALPKVNP